MTDPMNGRWADLDTGPVASAQMIQWHAPKTWAAIEHAVRTKVAAARDVDWLGYAVVQMLDGPTGVEPYFFYDRRAADRYAAEVSEAHGPRLAVVEVHEVEEAAP